ncbi:MAG: hypothetical protein V7607_123 [Solirubrobacteraceae bacterium]
MTGAVLQPGERFGRWYDDFEVGAVHRHWPGKTITQAEDHIFCLLTMAASPVHVDAHYAATQMEHGRNIVVGTFVYALLVGMSVADTSGRAIAALGTERLEHLHPVFHGDTLYATSEILAKRESRSRPNAGIVRIRTEGANHAGETVCRFERSFMVPKKESE